MDFVNNFLVKMHIFISYGYAQLKSEQTGDGDDANEAVRARSQQSCLNSIGKIDYKVKILPSSVHSDAHTRMSLKVTEKYLTGATSRQYVHIRVIIYSFFV